MKEGRRMHGNCSARLLQVNFNEPLSVLQRISEDLEYAHLLDTAAEKTDPLEQMCYVTAFAVSAYSTTGNRTTKPFNPLLGETFECDRTADLGWRSLAEQVRFFIANYSFDFENIQSRLR